MMANMELISLTLSRLLPFLLLLHPLLLLQVPLLLLLQVLVLLLLVGLHLQLLLSLPELPLIGARSRIFILRSSRLSSLCVAPTTLLSESLISR
jgi:hypothetical protein